MAKQDRRTPPSQPAEDMFGRPTGPRHEAPPREDTPRQPAPGREAGRDAPDSHPRPMDPAERTPGAALDEIPDGDGPRSDAGTNPLPEVYWSAYRGHPKSGDD